jgi:hypothetical protein
MRDMSGAGALCVPAAVLSLPALVALLLLLLPLLPLGDVVVGDDGVVVAVVGAAGRRRVVDELMIGNRQGACGVVGVRWMWHKTNGW